VGWSPTGQLIYTTDALSGLPDMQLLELDISSGSSQRLPLAQADDGCYLDGRLFFNRYRFQGSHTKRYQGGTVQQLWSFAPGEEEAIPLTADYKGSSREPMCWRGRIYFASDRDGTMNIWSMDPQGADLQQHSHHHGWDLLGPTLSEGQIVYQLGADLRHLDLLTGKDQEIPIRLLSDFDQSREHWIKKPMKYLSAVDLAPDGERLLLTARGRLFVAPRKEGRFLEISQAQGVRHREGRFMPDGKRVLSLSDASGEVELWTLPANGVGQPVQLSQEAKVLRWEGLPSPNGRLIAHHDKDNQLWIYDLKRDQDKRIQRGKFGRFQGLTWSADSRWLAYSTEAENLNEQIYLYDVQRGSRLTATTDRYNSFSPRFSKDGKWLYLISERHLKSLIKSPWGRYQPEPLFDKRSKIYMLALQEGLRSPFAPPNELQLKREESDNKEKNSKKKGKSRKLQIKADGLSARLYEVPVPPGNFSELTSNGELLFWVEEELGSGNKSLKAFKVGYSAKPKVVTVAEKIHSFQLSADGRSLMIRLKKAIHVVDAKAEKIKLKSKNQIQLKDWRLSVQPREEWRQMFIESWRLERDYFYDPGMHGVDWPGMLERYLPLVSRVRSRAELSDLMAQMSSELAALHIFVYGGDHPKGHDEIKTGSLGARIEREVQAGGWRIEHIYRSDPDEPERCAPLAAPDLQLEEGDLILSVNGRGIEQNLHLGALLRGQAGKQVLLRVKPKAGGPARDLIVKAISAKQEKELRYHEWEYSRRLRVEEQGGGEIGYLHLRAMGAKDIAAWARGFYPVFKRPGLIIDLRHNRGGNIDSWIIEKLLRRAWGAWSERVTEPSITNMQFAFRGYLIFLCDGRTASDGEAILEAARRLKLGPILGIRTWGGGIWLSSSNRLVDKGIVTAAEFGMFGPEGKWIIEGEGITPDIHVDNLPHATFKGGDLQLDTAIRLLKKKISAAPIPALKAPAGKKLNLKSR